jgi:membrane-associated phospholipid phosphatase
MGSALVLAGVHPATDVMGAGLLAVAALTGTGAAGLGHWASDPQMRSVG